MSLLAVDPGIRGCGVAAFDGGRLLHAAYVKSRYATGNRAEEAADMARAVARWCSDLALSPRELVVEWPRVYADMIRRGSKHVAGKDPNDLLPLAGVDGALAALFVGCRATSYAPSEWKGQMPKEVCHARTRLRLDSAEVVIYVGLTKVLDHNARDAVGLGLHHLGRLAPRRTT